MFDAALQPLLRRLTDPLAKRLDRIGLTADQASIAGFLIGVCAVPALASGDYMLAMVLILANRAADGLDGALARQQGPTDRGAFLDIALDFAFYALVVLGFALADPAVNALPAAVLLAGFMGTGSSFLAFAILAERRKLDKTAFPLKGIHYLGGWTEGFETILVLLAMCLWPQGFPVLAYGFAAACALTTFGRWAMAYDRLGRR